MMDSRIEPPHGNVLVEQIRQLRRDVGRVEMLLEKLAQDFDRSVTKQGERIGIVEDDLIKLRADLKWTYRVVGIFWALAQMVMMAAVRYWRDV